MLEPGSRVADYEILELVGRGTTSVTYSAQQLSRQRLVALKIPHKNVLSDPTFVIRFLQEGALGSKLKHHSIVRVYEAGEEKGLLYIAMELVSGTTLTDHLDGKGPFAVVEALNLIRAVADALAYAHANQVVHRDLKPDHLMLLPGGGIKILDLGVARAVGEVGVTSDDVFLGTPRYAAPETISPKAADHRSDLYSLGIILFEMLEGHPPFAADSDFELMIKQQEQELPKAAELKHPLPEPVYFLIESLCSKHPEDRPQDTSDVVITIDQILANLA